MEYTSVGQAAELANKGALMAKLDLKSAYRMVPVHPADQHLHGLEWQGTIYCDQVTIWLMFSSQHFHSCSRWPTMGYEMQGNQYYYPLS